MITSTISFAAHLYSSLQGVQSIGRALGYVLPYSTMVKAKKNYNTKHLSKGDPVPPFSKLRVFNMRFCPFAERTMLTLIAKNIDYDLVNVDLVDKPEWLPAKSAFGKVPALEIADGKSIYESLVTVEYLDEVYPQRPLLPKDPLLKAKDKIIVEAIGGVHVLFYNIVKNPEAVNEQGIAAFFKSVDFIQEELKQRGTKFLDGEQPGYADYMIWPWFERLISLDSDITKLDERKYKLLLAYIESMLQDPVVSEYSLSKDILNEFHKPLASGAKPNYDLLLKN